MDTGLIQTKVSKYSYTGKIKTPGNIIEKRIILKLPLFLNCETWTRHGLSMSDIKSILERFSTHYLWQFALLLNISASPSVVKLSFATPESMLYTSKSVVIKKIMSIVNRYGVFINHRTILCGKLSGYSPVVPVHSIGVERWLALDSLLPASEVDITKPAVYPVVFKWNGIYMVPINKLGKRIYTVRVIKSTYNHHGTGKLCSYYNSPIRIIAEEEEFSGVDEACFFVE